MYDYHTHSSFSDDCDVSMKTMLEAAISKGVKEIAVTDHYDPDYPDPEFPFIIDFDRYHQKLLSYEQEFAPKIKIIKGIEIGIQHGETLQKCSQTANAFPYDFIIGSFHCCRGYDLYKYDYSEIGSEKAVQLFYEYMYECLSKYDDYDIVGHFNIIDRYIPYVPEYEPYRDTIAEILKLLIKNGKGIELNTSSFRYGMGDRTTASREIFLLYKDLFAGQKSTSPFDKPIVTFGSDAHRTEDIAYMYKEGIEYLKSLGFDHLATFEKREMQLVRI